MRSNYYTDTSGLPEWLAITLGIVFIIVVLFSARSIISEVLGEWRSGICEFGDMGTFSKATNPSLFFFAAFFKTFGLLAVLVFVGYILFLGAIIALGYIL